MPRYLKIHMICILFLVFAVPASSELYQYKDENGITRLTDNVYSVPIKYRSQLEQYSEIKNVPDEMEIQPLKNKSLPQAKQEKIITPKMTKEITETAEKNITPPSIMPDAAEKTAAKPKELPTTPFQPIVPKKSEQTPETEVSKHEIHKSLKIKIDKKTSVAPETAKKEPKKDIKKSVESETTKKAAPTPQSQKKELPEKTAALETVAAPDDAAETEETSHAQNLPSSEQSVPKQDGKTKKDVPVKTVIDNEKPSAEPRDKQAEPMAVTVKTGPETKKETVPVKKTEKKEIPDKIPPAQVDLKPVKPALKTQINTADKAVSDNKNTASSRTEAAPPAREVKKVDQVILPPQQTSEISQTEKKEISAKITPGQVDLKPDKKTDPEQTAKSSDIIPEKKLYSEPQSVQTPSNTESPTIATDIPKTTVPEIEKHSDQTEKFLAEKPGPPAAGQSIAKNPIQPDGRMADNKPDMALKTEKIFKGKDAEKTIEPVVQSQAEMESIKVKTGNAADKTVVKEAANSVTTALNTDQNQLAETEKLKFASRQTVSENPESMKNSDSAEHAGEALTDSQVIEKSSSTFNEKDETLRLAKLESNRKLLANKKEALNKKYLDLMKEKQEIENSVNEDDEKSVLAYNENVKKLNLKIKQYKKEKKLLQAEIEKYNRSIQQSSLN